MTTVRSGNNHDGLLPIDNDALVLRGTLIGTTLAKTFPIGEHIVFVDDGPSIDVAAGNDASVLLTTQDADTDGDPTDEDTDSSAANFSSVFSIASHRSGRTARATTDAQLWAEPGGCRRHFVRAGQRRVPIRLYDIGGVIIGSTAATEAGVNGSNTILRLGGRKRDRDTDAVCRDRSRRSRRERDALRRSNCGPRQWPRQPDSVGDH